MILRWLRARAAAVTHWFRVRPWLTLLVLIVLGMVLGANRLDAESSARTERIDREADARCRDNQDNRAVIRELVDVATTPTGGGGADLSRLTLLPEFARLSPEDQAYWRAFYAAVSTPRPDSDGDGKPDSTNEALIRFAEERLTPIECGPAKGD